MVGDKPSNDPLRLRCVAANDLTNVEIVVAKTANKTN